MLKAIIIDDEQNNLEYLETLVTEFIPEVELIGTSKSAVDGLKLVIKLEPDLLFLDIEMPKISEIDIAEMLTESQTQVILTSAHKEYAIQAIRANVRDYLLKPIDLNDLKDAVDILLKEKEQAVNSSTSS